MKSAVTTAALWRLFLPLAMSWVFMALEQPSLTRILNGMPDFELTKAALYLLMGLSLFFESPVIDLLSTATALGRNAKNIAAVRKFALLMMGLTFATHGLFAFTPLYGWLTITVLQQKPDVAAVAHAPFMVMSVWAAFVGWRRAHQGFMIRAGMTRAIGLGTVARLATLIATTIFCAKAMVPPVISVAIGLVLSVVVEAAYVHIISRSAVHQLSESANGTPEKSQREIAAFHFPQTATTLVVMLTAPAISLAIASGADPIKNQSAWSMAFALQWLFRAAIYALPELVIANGDDAADRPVLARFCFLVGGVLSLIMLAVSLTPLGELVFRGALGASSAEAARALPALLLCAALPLIGSGMSLYRGFLTMSGVTIARLWAILAGFSFMVVGLFVGNQMALPGILVASIGLICGQIAEGLVLWSAWRGVERRERRVSTPA
ncbi:MAG: hypothetical protein KF812_09435 [Fimbriimonadaceae bacterium]|nr:hypothetical protein [Fimbriimonadaceae bacterium]